MSSNFVNPRQIAKYQTGKNLIEFNDRLVPANGEQASQIHAKHSKIYVVALDYSQGKGDKAIVADLNIDPDTAKYLAEEVLRGTHVDFSEQKILTHKKHPENDKLCKVTIFTVKYNEKLRYPWNVVVENGWGIPEIQENGGTALAKGSYQKEKAVKVFLSDNEFKKIMVKVRDYIRTFELVNFPNLMRMREEFEEKEKRKQK